MAFKNKLLERYLERIIRTEVKKLNENSIQNFHHAVNSGNINEILSIVGELDDDSIIEFEDDIASLYGEDYSNIAAQAYLSAYDGYAGRRAKSSLKNAIDDVRKKLKR